MGPNSLMPDHHVGVALTWFGLAIGGLMEAKDLVLLFLVVGVGAAFHVLMAWREGALVARQHAQDLMENVFNYSPFRQVVGQFRQAQGGKRQVVVRGAPEGDPGDLFALLIGEFRRTPARVVGRARTRSVGDEVVQHVADRSPGWLTRPAPSLPRPGLGPRATLPAPATRSPPGPNRAAPHHPQLEGSLVVFRCAYHRAV